MENTKVTRNGQRGPIPARLFLLFAREAPIAVVFRRGPSRWVQVIRWHTDTDVFEPGQWFHGRIYERRADLTPDGSLLIYFANRFNERFRKTCAAVIRMSFVGLLLLGLQGPASAQATSSDEQFRALRGQLRVATEDDVKRYTPEFRDRLTNEVKALLARRVVDVLNHDERDMTALSEALRRLDPGNHLDEEFSKAPYVFRTLIHGEPVVVTGFLLLRGGAGAPDTKVILQAFRRDTSGWRCVAETGDELDHHALMMMELPSQRTGESWVLAYGNRTGANGRMVRIRAYTFDGAKFSVLWAPPDRLGGEIKFADGMVTVRSIDEVRYYELRQPPYKRVEKFLLTVQGVEQLASLPGRQ